MLKGQLIIMMQIPRALQAAVRHQLVVTRRRCACASKPVVRVLCSGICTKPVDIQIKAKSGRLASSHGSRVPVSTSKTAAA